MKILVSLSLIESTSTYLPIAKKLNKEEFLFIGFLKTLGSHFVQNGFNYSYCPFVNISKNEINDDILPVVEYQNIKNKNLNFQYKFLKTVSFFRKYIKEEILKFSPDLVIITQTNYLTCHLTMIEAKKMGIPVISFHSTFVKNRFFVNSENVGWEQKLRELPINENDHYDNSFIKLRNGEKSIDYNSKIKYSSLKFKRSAERLIRQLPFINSIESPYDIAQSIKAQNSQKWIWFPDYPTVLNNNLKNYILVAIHQPLIDSKRPNWETLVLFALNCSPLDVNIVLRPHPNEKAPLNISNELIKALKGRSIYISRQNSGPPLSSIIENCLLLITINSATGIEALLQNKPVFTIAKAFYTRIGCAEFIDVKDFMRLRLMIVNNKITKPNSILVNQFIYKIIKDYSYQDHSEYISNLLCKLK